MNMRWVVVKLISSIVLRSDLNFVGSEEYICFEIIQGFIDDVFAIRWRSRTTTGCSQWQQRKICQLLRAFGNRMISLKWKWLHQTNDTPHAKSKKWILNLVHLLAFWRMCSIELIDVTLTIIQRVYGQISTKWMNRLRYNWHARWIRKTD